MSQGCAVRGLTVAEVPGVSGGGPPSGTAPAMGRDRETASALAASAPKTVVARELRPCRVWELDRSVVGSICAFNEKCGGLFDQGHTCGLWWARRGGKENSLFPWVQGGAALAVGPVARATHRGLVAAPQNLFRRLET